MLATGARPRRPWAEVPAGVHVLRSLDDAIALRTALVPGARLVVVGAGFVGAEVASTAHKLGVDVTVVEAAPAPLSGPLGVEMGAVVAGLHAEHGVPLIVGVGVTGFRGSEEFSSFFGSDRGHRGSSWLTAAPSMPTSCCSESA